MSDRTARLSLRKLVEGQEMDAFEVNRAFNRLDAFSDLYLKGHFTDTPPSSPADGDMYLIGGAPTGAWSGYPFKIAYGLDGGWKFRDPFDGLRAFVEGENRFIVYQDGAWTDWNALISAAEDSITSAATCDLGAAESLFLEVTGTSAITSLGSGANLLRFVRFADALILTHDATSLVLPGAASIATAAGDTTIFSSDGVGNWRCRHYSRASGQPVATALDAASLSATGVVGGAGGLSWGGATVGTFSGYTAASGLAGANGCLLQMQGPAGADWAHIRLDQSGGTMSGLAITTRIDKPININPNETQTLNVQAGFVGVGTTTNGGWGGNAKLESVAGSAAVALSGYNTSSSGKAMQLRVDNASASIADFYCSTSFVGSITTNGTATTYGTTSDARLKNWHVAQGDYRAAIQALWVGDFTWKDSGAPGFGVLAQQAWDVMPNHQGVTPPGDEGGIWQAAAEPFAHLALWGVKDLYALVEALAARVAALEAAHDAG